MKHVFKWVLWVTLTVWVIVVSLGVIIVVDRQKRFEAATIMEVEFLMQELSETNINASFLDLEIKKILEKQDRILDQISNALPSDLEQRGRCGERKEDQ